MTTIESLPITGQMLIADRKRRGKLSRKAYRELTGLNESRQGTIEKDQPLKVGQHKGQLMTPEEYQQLYPFIYDSELGAPTVDAPAVTPESTPEQAQPAAVAGEEASPPFAESPTGSTPPAEPPTFVPPPPAFEDLSSTTPEVATANEQPVELISGEELDDPEALAEDVIIPGSGLPEKVTFTIPGYHVTNSELQTFKRCKRKWWLAYYRELKLVQPEITGARSLGTRLHLALSAHYSTRKEDPMAVLEKTIAEDRAILESRGDLIGLDDLEKDAQLARIMLEGYLEWLQEEGRDDGYEVLGDEVIVEVPFLTAEQVDWDKPIILAGKMDLRLRRFVDNAILFLDHKSVGSLKEPLKTLHMDEQMLHYHLLEYLKLVLEKAQQGEAEGEYAAGALYNMLRKVKRTVRANPPFYDRVEIHHNRYELNSYWKRVYGEVIDIVELRKKLDAGADPQVVAYPSPRSTCSWDCDFLSVCPLFDDGSAAEQMLASLYEPADPHDHYRPYGDRTDTAQEG